MNKSLKYFYYIITAIFMFLTLFEIYTYMKMESNYLGLFYLFLNLFIMFLLFTISYNYDKSNKEIRISKNIMAIIFGLIASFILGLLLPNIFNYKDASYLFTKNIKIISKIIKPIIYIFLGVASYVEIKLIKKLKS